MDKNIIEKLNSCLLDTENLANNFLPLDETLSTIKDDVSSTLTELKTMSETSEELSDKVFYINRYTDLIKKIDSIFDARARRLQNSLSMLSKLALVPGMDTQTINDSKSGVDNSESSLSPEQCAKIFAILQNEDRENDN